MIHSVLVQVRAPKDGDPGQVTEGFYKVEDSHLQMTYRDGVPLENPLYRVLLPAGADARTIAGKLTKEARREMQGEQVEGFARELNYPRGRVA